MSIEERACGNFKWKQVESPDVFKKNYCEISIDLGFQL